MTDQLALFADYPATSRNRRPTTPPADQPLTELIAVAIHPHVHTLWTGAQAAA